MARRTALPGGALDQLMKEAPKRTRVPVPGRRGSGAAQAARRAPRRSSRVAAKTGRIVDASGEVRSTAGMLHDPVARYAASRGVVVAGGPLESARLVFQMAVDVRELAKKERVGVFTVVARALAGYISDRE